MKKLISTSYAPESKTAKYGSLFEYAASQSDETPKNERGKIFALDHDTNRNGRIDFEDLEWEYLKGDGDFRSEEVCHLRDESDVIVTNPPFSMFREFLAWIVGGGVATKNTMIAKRFLIIGNMNAITYKEVFPLIMGNKLWLGNGFSHGNAYFRIAEGSRNEYADGVYDPMTNLVKFRNVAWFTNLEHGRRHQPLQLMTMAQNIKHSKHKEVRGIGYRRYDNYDAIEVPFTDAIPGDYDGVMGVPISFLDKYCPEQFEILGATQRGCHDAVPDTRKYDDYWEVKQDGKRTGSSGGKTNENGNLLMNDGKRNYFVNTDGRIIQSAYQRIFIRHRHKSCC